MIDISKYVLTGVVISSFFRDFGDHKFLIYGFGVMVSALALVAGLLLINKKIMEAIFVLSLIGIPCLVFIVYCFTPQGKKWRRIHGML